jgi:hypothetical protein
MTLQPHQQRVVEEKTALDEKIQKLQSFMATPAYLSLDWNEQRRLYRQHSAMVEYSTVLDERIGAF